MIGYKLLRLRRDGSLGSLFINRKAKYRCGLDYPAENHPTKGYAVRPGWHVCKKPHAPHLSMKGRVWCMVSFTHKQTIKRPESQGGIWYLGSDIRIIRILTAEECEALSK